MSAEQRPTPETDEFEDGCINPDEWAIFARRREREKTELLEALVKISESIECDGPGCIYCERESEHPTNFEAKLARAALAKASGLGAELKWNSEADEYNQWDELGQEERDTLITEFISANEPEEAEANARLIAAAPELLEAVIALIVTGDSGYGTPTDKAWEMAEAALAKATGKEGA